MELDDAKKMQRLSKARQLARKRDSNGKPWEPSARDLEVYAENCKMLKSQTEIGKGLTPPMTKQGVSRICRDVAKWIWRETLDDIKEIKASHVDQLRHVINEAMREWDRSKLEGYTETEESGRGPDGQFVKNKLGKVTKHQCGNPKYLDIVIKSLDEIRKIMGANAPVEVKHSGEVRYAGMSQEQAVENRIIELQKHQEIFSVSEN